MKVCSVIFNFFAAVFCMLGSFRGLVFASAEPEVRAVWYVHLQRHAVPYSERISNRIEADFRNNSEGVSASFTAPNSVDYFVDFADFVQYRARKTHVYRNVRRVVYDVRQLGGVSPAELYSTKLTLTFRELEHFNGHMRNYLSEEEILRKKVTGEGEFDERMRIMKRAIIFDSMRRS